MSQHLPVAKILESSQSFAKDRLKLATIFTCHRKVELEVVFELLLLSAMKAVGE